MRLSSLLCLQVVLFALAVGWACQGAEANATTTTKSVTYKIMNDKDNAKAAKGYAVFVDVTPDKIDLTKTKGTILKDVRLEPRPPLGTLIVFENKDMGIAPGKQDDIQIHFKPDLRK